MSEFVYNVGSQADLQKLAKATGWGNGTNIRTTGPLTDGSDGEYFLNHHGVVLLPTGNTIQGPIGPYPEMAAQPGEWGRLRVNGSNTVAAAFLSGLRTAATALTISITIYEQQIDGSWSSDGGATIAPNWVASIGLIA